MTNTDTPPRPKWASATTTPKQNGRPNSWLIIGAPGKGKTTLAASICQVAGFNKVLLIDVEHGSETLAQNPLFENIEILSIDPVKDPAAKLKLDAVIDDICENDYGYDAVILDTLSIAQDIAEKYIKANNSDPKNGFAVYSEIGTWTFELMQKLHTTKHFTALITCHTQEQKADSGAYRVLPRLTGSSKDTIASIPSVVGLLEHVPHPQTGDLHRMLTVGETSHSVTKNRFGLPPQIIDPSMIDIYNLINERTGNHASAA